MQLILTNAAGNWDITSMVGSVSISGDKSIITRALQGTVLCHRALSAPRPALGDGLTLREGGDTLYSGYVVKRTMDSDSATMSISGYDKGMWLRNNQYTGKFRGAAPDYITRSICHDLGIPIDGLAAAPGVLLSRKFTGLRTDQVIQTVYSLAGEQTGERYTIRMTPKGLLVKLRTVSAASVNIVPRSNLQTATTTESIYSMVNRVAIYDDQGVRLTSVQDDDAVRLYGVMEQHIVQREGESAMVEAKARLEDGRLAQTVTVTATGNAALVTGETAVVVEPGTGLTGVFWIDADTQTWKNGIWTSKLTLNCRNIMDRSTGGVEL